MFTIEASHIIPLNNHQQLLKCVEKNMRKEKREDRRNRYTRMVIKKAYVDLLKQNKNFNEISVAEICRIADINRSTFYIHYLDVYDVLDDLIDEVIERVFTNSIVIFKDGIPDLSSGEIIYRDIMKDERLVFLMSKFSDYTPYIEKASAASAESIIRSLPNDIKLPQEELRAVITSLLFSYQIMDRRLLKDHTIKELESYNSLFNEYLIKPFFMKIAGNEKRSNQT